MPRRNRQAHHAADAAAKASALASAMRAFANAPGSTFFYSGAAHKKTLEGLVRALRDRLGLHLVLGDFGTGKTTLCNFVLMAYAHEFVMGYLGNPFLDETELFRHMARSLGCDCQGLTTAKDHLDALEAFLRRQHMERKVCVFFLDEAHLLDPLLLDRLLVLSNLQISGVPLLQVVLAGVPGLLTLLDSPRHGSLGQRLGSRHWLRPLTRAESREYVRHRLAHVGCEVEIFSGRALAAVQRRSSGRPRLVNLLCRLSLEACARQGQGQVSPAHVREAASDPAYRGLFREAGLRRGRGLAWLAGAPLAAAAGLAVLLALNEARRADFWPDWLGGQARPSVSAPALPAVPSAAGDRAGNSSLPDPEEGALRQAPMADRQAAPDASPLAEEPPGAASGRDMDRFGPTQAADDGTPRPVSAMPGQGRGQPGGQGPDGSEANDDGWRTVPGQDVAEWAQGLAPDIEEDPEAGPGAGTESGPEAGLDVGPSGLPEEALEPGFVPEPGGEDLDAGPAEPLPPAAAPPKPAPPPEEVTRALLAELEPVWGRILHGEALPPELASARVHAIAWSAVPEQRMALVGEAIVRIGESLAGGTVAAIGEEYVLVARQGERYLLQIAPRQ